MQACEGGQSSLWNIPAWPGRLFPAQNHAGGLVVINGAHRRAGDWKTRDPGRGAVELSSSAGRGTARVISFVGDRRATVCRRPMPAIERVFVLVLVHVVQAVVRGEQRAYSLARAVVPGSSWRIPPLLVDRRPIKEAGMLGRCPPVGGRDGAPAAGRGTALHARSSQHDECEQHDARGGRASASARGLSLVEPHLRHDCSFYVAYQRTKNGSNITSSFHSLFS